MKNTLLSILFSAVFALTGCTATLPENNSAPAAVPQNGADMVSVHYIDVGQGDCELVQLPNGQNMLIDAGTRDAESDLLSYLNKHGVQRIDYLIATHPHADHIGSMDTVVNKYDIGEIYMPRAKTTTKTFERLLTAIDNKGLSIHTAKPNDVIFNEGGASAVILAPNKDSYKDLNNYSVVVKLTYGDNSFLFTGDAEDVSEQEMLRAGADVSADVLKVGHHGSHSSTTSAFLDAVKPSIAVISCGTGNSYGHPHEETMSALNKRNITIYRTDKDGSVVLTSDGKQIQKQ